MRRLYLEVAVIVMIIALLAGFLLLQGGTGPSITPPTTPTETTLKDSLESLGDLTDGAFKISTETEIDVEELTEEAFELTL